MHKFCSSDQTSQKLTAIYQLSMHYLLLTDNHISCMIIYNLRTLTLQVKHLG